MPVVVHSSPGVVLPRLEFSDRQGQIRSGHCIEIHTYINDTNKKQRKRLHFNILSVLV